MSRGVIEKNRVNAREHGLTDVLVQEDREVADSVLAAGAPSGVLVSAEGQLASPLAAGARAITDLVRSSTEPPFAVLAAPDRRDRGLPQRSAPETKLQVGAELPDLAWENLDERPVSVRALRGNRVALIFWNPRCGFCERLLPDLRAWETARSNEVHQLVIVSNGTVEEIRALGLKFPVILEDDFRTGRVLRVTGTPSAVLVNEQGINRAGGRSGPSILALLAAKGEPRGEGVTSSEEGARA